MIAAVAFVAVATVLAAGCGGSKDGQQRGLDYDFGCADGCQVLCEDERSASAGCSDRLLTRRYELRR